MKQLITLFVILFTVEGSRWCRQSTPRVQLILPEMALAGEDMLATCVADHEDRPRVRVIRDDECNAKVELLDIDVKNEKCGRTNFRVQYVNTTCTYQCILHQSCDQKTVPIVDAKTVSSPSNVTVSEGMPVRLNCTVMANAHLRHHKLLWVKGNTFVPSGDPRYSMWSSQFDYDTKTQDYYMTIRQVEHTAAYTCALVSTSGKVIDSQTHDIFVTEADSMITSLLQYLAKFFWWHKET